MKSRQEIKAQAKSAMAAQRGVAILTLLLITLLGGVAGIIGFVVERLPLIGGLIVQLLNLAIAVIATPLSVNVNGSFINIYRGEKATASDPLSNLSVNFWRKLGGMLWMGLWAFLWSLLLIIPGIIKGIAYSMTPFILADCPSVTAKDALKLSMRMTDGHKGKLFIFSLSFLGWALLVPLTLGILAIVYVGPYASTAFAGYYIELRDEAIASGRILPEELGLYGYEPEASSEE